MIFRVGIDIVIGINETKKPIANPIPTPTPEDIL
jgi:hypothetical protein